MSGETWLGETLLEMLDTLEQYALNGTKKIAHASVKARAEAIRGELLRFSKESNVQAWETK